MDLEAVCEIELKLEAEPTVLKRVRRSRLLNSLATGAATTETIETVYFDSSDQRLAKKNIALRIRKRGRTYEQTAKAETKANGAAPMRIEWSSPVEGPSPRAELIGDEGIRKRVSKLIAKGDLAPYCRTLIRRTSQTLKTEEGNQIELAFDAGELLPPNGSEAAAPISELELELRAGSAKGLVSLARRLAEEFPLRLAMKSKAERGLEIATQRRFSPCKAGDVELSPETSVGTAFAVVLSHCLRHALANEDAIRHARDPEGVHQMRVALRRLRSAMDTFGKPLRTGEIVRLRAEAKWLAGLLGRARDYDVFLAETIEPLMALRPDDQRLVQLARLVQSEWDEAWRETCQALDGARYRLFMIDLGGGIVAEAWRADVADPEAAAILASTILSHAKSVLAKRFAKAAELGKRIAELDIAERHLLRIELKKLRYAGEFFESLFPGKATKTYLKRVAELQDVFGYLNDAATAQEIVERTLSEAFASGLDRSLSWAGGLVTGWHEARANEAWSHAQERWKALEKAEPFWVD